MPLPRFATRHLPRRFTAGALISVALALPSVSTTIVRANAQATTSSAPAVSTPASPEVAEAIEIVVPNTTVRFVMRRLPLRASADVNDDQARPVSLWIGETEVVWDLYDVFVYRLDEADPEASGTGADATTRPSKPYVPPDRGFGHHGYPAMGMTHHAATQFCAWLSERTGHRFRLPSEAEWEAACLAHSTGPFCFGDDESRLDAFAWHEANADGTTHPVGTRERSALGLADLHGNVAEWVNGRDGKPVAKGGSYRDGTAALQAEARQKQLSAWNASDPQIPKSRWWLADCSFVGFRLVMEDAPGAAQQSAGANDHGGGASNAPTNTGDPSAQP